jgi:hypothetical protein
MLSQGIAWIGRAVFVAGIFVASTVIAGQALHWLAEAEWPAVATDPGLHAFGIGPLQSRMKGLDLVLAFVGGSPFSLFSFAFGVMTFFVTSWLANRIPSGWLSLH